MSILHHCFSLFHWCTRALHARQVTLLAKSVQINVKLHIRVKGVFTIELLTKLIANISKFHLARVYKALLLTSFLFVFSFSFFNPIFMC